MQNIPESATNAVIVLTGLHSSHDPYCRDRDCWCHVNVIWHSQVTTMPQYSSEEICSAYRVFGVVRQ